MRKATILKAEQQFAATQKKAQKALKDKDKAQQDLTARLARQRALRLAKEAADKEAAEKAAADKAAAKSKKPSRLPQAQRRPS